MLAALNVSFKTYELIRYSTIRMFIKRIGVSTCNGLRYRSIHRSSICRALIVEMVPALGESITEGSIAKWIKSSGEKVNVDDVIVIVETDKVTVDIKSVRSGVLTKQLASDTVRA